MLLILSKTKKENETLKKFLDEEMQLSRATLNERVKIRELIKLGHDAFEPNEISDMLRQLEEIKVCKKED
jgi:hypothetical protein